MDKSPHCALSGEGAREFSLSQGNFDKICVPKDHKSIRGCPYQRMPVLNERFVESSEHICRGGEMEVPDNAVANVRRELGKSQDQQGHDTVSAVAIDRKGYLACANPSGTYIYLWNKLPY